MDREQLREEWLQELESGKHKQIHDNLCAEGGYCCLGVACLVYGRHSGDEFVNEEEDSVLSFLSEMGVLPKDVIEAFGFNGRVGNLKKVIEVNDYLVDSLVDLNDEVELSFQDIAKFVRENPDSVWK